MIGDRYLTDIVYGNRNGLLTIRPAPLTLEGEPSAVLLVSRHAALLHQASKVINASCLASLVTPYQLHCVQARRIEDHYVRKWTRHGIQVSDNSSLLLLGDNSAVDTV